MRLFSLCFALLLAAGAPALLRAAAPAPAQVVLDISDFHSIDESGAPFTEAATVLVTHPAVTLAAHDGLPTLSVRQPLTLELTALSSDTGETYTPLAVVFEQQGAASDPVGARNFTVTPTAHGTLLIVDRCATTGADGCFEFFVVVRRDCDGALGIIDPGLINLAPL